MNRLTALIAFVALTAFVAILAIAVPSPDLIAIVILTVALVAYDFISSSSSSDK